MSVELYLAIKPEEQALDGVRELRNMLPPNSIYLPHIGCLGDVRKSQNDLGIHMSVLDGMIPNPSSIKDFDRRMKITIKTAVPRNSYPLRPIVSNSKGDLILVPNDEGERDLRIIRTRLADDLEVDVREENYWPHATLARLDKTADLDLIRERINELTVIFRILTVYACLRGPSRRPISNTFRPGPPLRN